MNYWGPNCLPFVDKQTEKARFKTGLGCNDNSNNNDNYSVRIRMMLSFAEY